MYNFEKSPRFFSEFLPRGMAGLLIIPNFVSIVTAISSQKSAISAFDSKSPVVFLLISDC